MILLKRKLIRTGNSKGITIPKEYLEHQGTNKHLVVYVLSKQELSLVDHR